MTKRARLSFVELKFTIAAVTSLLPRTEVETATTGSSDAKDNGHPIVIELFISQGCYSCPPDDKYVGDLKQRYHVIPRAYHLGYWDYIG